MWKYNFLDGFNLSDSHRKDLENRIYEEIETVVNPFSKRTFSWVMNEYARKMYFHNFPKGGYDSEEEAVMALNIHQLNQSLTYEKLVSLSKMFVCGINNA
jgi:hypothetical protein